MPLRPDGKKEKSKPAETSASDAEWEQARDEVLGRKRLRNGDEPGRIEYDQHAVDQLKRKLTESLRNAANIRHLKPDEWITIVVRGRSTAEISVIAASEPFTFELKNDLLIPGVEEHSTMVLRARKRDLDEAAKNKESVDSFKKRVTVATY